ncbi:glycine-rich RNA-binding protein 3, mitochondrial-like [Bidens hawaiensis]|uniref:glycine-rich RNA-binding protein 3, mitochondrial-like n=1 Tax=Bidens hawaiensis TaxID=980011 RepID=UPI00404AF3A2
MALFKRAGNVLRQTVSKHIDINEMSVPSPHILRQTASKHITIGNMTVPSPHMCYKVFVGGLASATDDTSLRETFSSYGEVSEARVVIDRETGKSKGFGFVTFEDFDSGFYAIVGMDQWELHGQTVSVCWANDRARDDGGGFRFRDNDEPDDFAKRA